MRIAQVVSDLVSFASWLVNLSVISLLGISACGEQSLTTSSVTMEPASVTGSSEVSLQVVRPPEVVDFVDLDRYQGLWDEIASWAALYLGEDSPLNLSIKIEGSYGWDNPHVAGG